MWLHTRFLWCWGRQADLCEAPTDSGFEGQGRLSCLTRNDLTLTDDLGLQYVQLALLLFTTNFGFHYNLVSCKQVRVVSTRWITSHFSLTGLNNIVSLLLLSGSAFHFLSNLANQPFLLQECQSAKSFLDTGLSLAAEPVRYAGGYEHQPCHKNPRSACSD